LKRRKVGRRLVAKVPDPQLNGSQPKYRSESHFESKVGRKRLSQTVPIVAHIPGLAHNDKAPVEDEQSAQNVEKSPQFHLITLVFDIHCLAWMGLGSRC